jgi:hypothetical protein
MVAHRRVYPYAHTLQYKNYNDTGERLQFLQESSDHVKLRVCARQEPSLNLVSPPLIVGG